MSTAYSAPWDAAFTVTGETGEGYTSAIGRTYPSAQESVYVPSAAQDAPPEAGEGESYVDYDTDLFGFAGVTTSYIDQTPYQPPGVAPGVPWNAPPWKTNVARNVDHGAPGYFTHATPPDKGRFHVRDQMTPSVSRGIETDNLGNLVLTDIGRPEHDMYFVVGRDNSPHWIDYEERPLANNLAVPAPYIEAASPSQYVPDGTYPNLSRNAFAAVAYSAPPDPQQFVVPQSGTPGYGTEAESEWE